MQVIGSIMKKPALLQEGLAASLKESDFDTKLLKVVFRSIYALSKSLEIITVIDVDNYVKEYPILEQEFINNNGVQFLQDCEDIAQEGNFHYYCERVKKFSALRVLKARGVDISFIYDDRITDPIKEMKLKEEFDSLQLHEIFDLVNAKVAEIEHSYIGFGSSTATANDGILELVESFKFSPEIGPPLQGDMYNTVVRGARPGKFYLRSGSTAAGKSRLMFGDATYLAYPYRYEPSSGQWEKTGSSQKALVITTELSIDEVQTIVLANLTGINEEKILFGMYTREEEERIAQGIRIMNDYASNLYIEQIGDPNITRIRATIKKHVLMNHCVAVFYDYIFTSPSLLGEFRDLRVREDVALNLLSTELKDLATEHNIFIMSGTQLSGDYEDVTRVKTQSLLRGQFGPITPYPAITGVLIL